MVTESPLPEDSEVHLLLQFPGVSDPVSVTGIVSHTVVVEDEDVPGMGIRFRLDQTDSATLIRLVDDLERRFMSNTLPEDYLM